MVKATTKEKDKGFNQDLIDCIDYLLKKMHGKEFFTSQDIFKEKWGKQRGYELQTFLSKNDALTIQGTKIKIIVPEGIRLREEAKLRLISVEQHNIQKIQTDILKSQSRANWWQVSVTIILLLITTILGYSNYKLLNKDIDISSKSSIPNKAELKIIPVDNYFFNRTRLFEDGHEITLNIENRGRIASGRVFLSLGTDLIYNQYPYTIRDIPDKNKTELRIKLITSCFGDKSCNEKSMKLPLGIYKLPIYVHCDSCEPISYNDIINLCIYGENYNYERCNQEYPR